MANFISAQPIMYLCPDSEMSPVDMVAKRWSEQKVLWIAGGWGGEETYMEGPA